MENNFDMSFSSSTNTCFNGKSSSLVIFPQAKISATVAVVKLEDSSRKKREKEE